MTASEARASLPELLDRVLAGDEVTITRHGRPVAVMVRPDSLRSRRADRALTSAAEVHALLAAAGTAPLPVEGISGARAEELISEIRAGRDGG